MRDAVDMKTPECTMEDVCAQESRPEHWMMSRAGDKLTVTTSWWTLVD